MSAGQLFDLIMPAALAASALISTWVLASARKRFRLHYALALAMGTATVVDAPPGLQVEQTGAWLLVDTTRLAPELEAFLDAGDPPVYLGLGSMPVPDGASRTLIDAARAVGRRVILSKGWAGKDKSSISIRKSARARSGSRAASVRKVSGLR